MKWRHINLLQYGTSLIFLIFPISNMLATQQFEWKFLKLIVITLYACSAIYMMNKNKNKYVFSAFCIVIVSITFFIHFCNVGNILFYLFPISYVPYALGKTVKSAYGQIMLITFVANYLVIIMKDMNLGIELMPHFLFIIMMMFSMDYFAEQSRKQYEMNIKNEKLALLSSQIERNRISQDLHDSLGQVFSTLAIKSELAMKLMDQYPEMAQDELKEIQMLSQTSLYKVRSIINDIKSTTIDDEVTHVGKILTDAGIEFERHVNYKHVGELQQHEISMLIKELINNVVKHSNATKVLLSVNQIDESLNLIIEDNGRGLPGNVILKSVETRVAAMGGTITTEDLKSGLGVYITIEVK
ncbi:sensor histidine kinase [Macrococcus sp. EM39E]|uniref:sensor histidine kinase n=1 Tax=Macrococcus animalis TaxID=3395467 RepID=UPI0039BE49A0